MFWMSDQDNPPEINFYNAFPMIVPTDFFEFTRFFATYTYCFLAFYQRYTADFVGSRVSTILFDGFCFYRALDFTSTMAERCSCRFTLFMLLHQRRAMSPIAFSAFDAFWFYFLSSLTCAVHLLREEGRVEENEEEEARDLWNGWLTWRIVVAKTEDTAGH